MTKIIEEKLRDSEKTGFNIDKLKPAYRQRSATYIEGVK
tara:strand:- start:107438 stop:107554 length:117 start_codon:yes stop_codon:yes gene_type:complete